MAYGAAAGGAAGGAHAAMRRELVIDAALHRAFPVRQDYANAVSVRSMIERSSSGEVLPLLTFIVAFLAMMCIPALLDSIGAPDVLLAVVGIAAPFVVYGISWLLGRKFSQLPARRALRDFVATLDNGPAMESRVREILKANP